MQRLPAVLLALSAISTQPAVAQSGAETTQLAVGVRIPLAVTRPVWSSSAKPGDPIYAQTTFPATVDDHVAIPSGTYVEGQIDSLTKPTRKVNHATFSIHFTKIIFAKATPSSCLRLHRIPSTERLWISRPALPTTYCSTMARRSR